MVKKYEQERGSHGLTEGIPHFSRKSRNT